MCLKPSTPFAPATRFRAPRRIRHQPLCQQRSGWRGAAGANGAPIDGQADVIGSGDKHLLALGSFRSIPIMTMRQLLEWLAVAGEDEG